MAAEAEPPNGNLLTPREAADRLRLDDVDEERWVRRACPQHGVPVMSMRMRGRVRLSEAQFRAALTLF